MSEGEVDAIRTFAVGRAGMDLGRAPRGVLDELGLEPAAWDELSRRCRAALDGSGRDRPSRCRALREAYRGEIASLLGVEASPSAIATPKQASRLAPAGGPGSAPSPAALGPRRDGRHRPRPAPRGGPAVPRRADVSA